MAVTFPSLQDAAHPAGIITAVCIGIAFGWCLERGGMGNARKLAGQFYLRDFTVIKVMFSALITAMLGVFWLGRLGVIDVHSLYVPETFLVPQVIGGVLFGAGFVIGGLCPGTSCVAAASGRLDGLAVMAGMFIGVLGFGIVFSRIQRIYYATSRGAFTLPTASHIPYGVIAAAICIGGLLMFGSINRFEQRRTQDVA